MNAPSGWEGLGATARTRVCCFACMHNSVAKIMALKEEIGKIKFKKKNYVM